MKHTHVAMSMTHLAKCARYNRYEYYSSRSGRWFRDRRTQGRRDLRDGLGDGAWKAGEQHPTALYDSVAQFRYAPDLRL
jgi:hypothetical protein